MAGWKEIIFKGVSAGDLGVVGAAQGNIMMAGVDPFTYANLTAGAADKVLTAHGVAAALTWETPSAAGVGAAQGNLLVAGVDPYTYADFTAGAADKVLTAHGVDAALTWETPSAAGNGAAQGNILVAGTTPYTYADFTAGTAGKVLTAGGVDAALTWETPTVGDFLADGTIPMTGDLDMDDNFIRDMKLYTTVPAVPADGHIYFDTSADKVKVYVA